MASDPPISTTVPETTTIETGVDKENLGNLNTDFADFWAEQDSKSDLDHEPAAPAAPGESGAAQETRETKAPKSTGIKAEPPDREPSEPPKAIHDYTDEEIDKMELLPNQRPEVYQGFKQVKDLWKETRQRLRAEADKARTLETQLAEARQNSLTPELKADYEHAVGIRRKFDFISDPEFLERFHVPVRNQYENILEEAVQALPDKQAARAWADHMKQYWQPEQLDREWWLQKVIDKVPNELDRSGLLSSVTQLLKMQRERDTEVHRRTEDRSAFENWINEKTTKTAERIQQEIMAEIGEQEKRIKEVLPVDVNAAKTSEERAAMEAHNERFTKLNKFFVDTVQDLSKHGPRAWVRAAVEATRTQIMDEQIKNLETENKQLKSERDQFKAELDKITGVRRKLINTSGTPPAGAQKKEAPSLKSGLDVRDSFKSFWDEQDRSP